MRFYIKKKRIPSITIVSLIDILAILLIFFIVTTTFRQKLSQLQINLPESTSATLSPATPTQKNIILQIKSEESMTLDNRPIALENLAEAIEEARVLYPNCKITMQADRDAPFGAVVKILDALQSAGIKNIPTMTRPSL